MNLEDTEKYIAEGHFAPGSMLPKVQAALKFAKSKPGRKALITSLEKAKEGKKEEEIPVADKEKLDDTMEKKSLKNIKKFTNLF